MRTIRKIALLTFLMSLFMTLPAVAQSNIEDQVRELESKNVMADKIVKRDPKTKKIGMVVKNFRFRSRGSERATALREAFEKDAGRAASADVNSRGDNYESVLTFVSGREKTVYKITISGDKSQPEVDLQVYYRDESVNIDESSVERTRNNGMATA